MVKKCGTHIVRIYRALSSYDIEQNGNLRCSSNIDVLHYKTVLFEMIYSQEQDWDEIKNGS